MTTFFLNNKKNLPPSVLVKRVKVQWSRVAEVTTVLKLAAAPESGVPMKTTDSKKRGLTLP